MVLCRSVYMYRMVDRNLQWFCVDMCICMEWWTGLYSGFVKQNISPAVDQINYIKSCFPLRNPIVINSNMQSHSILRDANVFFFFLGLPIFSVLVFTHPFCI